MENTRALEETPLIEESFFEILVLFRIELGSKEVWEECPVMKSWFESHIDKCMEIHRKERDLFSMIWIFLLMEFPAVFGDIEIYVRDDMVSASSDMPEFPVITLISCLLIELSFRTLYRIFVWRIECSSWK
jgi:hypothetical protein